MIGKEGETFFSVCTLVLNLYVISVIGEAEIVGMNKNSLNKGKYKPKYIRYSS